MESGLEDRNNCCERGAATLPSKVSMESGLEDRNNLKTPNAKWSPTASLNGVRPRRPEQSVAGTSLGRTVYQVSMESGLEDRNNLPLL